nr:hypothetical protein [Streptomyces sp. C8S0]
MAAAIHTDTDSPAGISCPPITTSRMVLRSTRVVSERYRMTSSMAESSSSGRARSLATASGCRPRTIIAFTRVMVAACPVDISSAISPAVSSSPRLSSSISAAMSLLVRSSVG